MLVSNALARDLAIKKLLLLTQLMVLTLADGKLGVRMNAFDSHITGIGSQFDPRVHANLGGLEQSEIMGFALSKCGANDSASPFIHHDLRLQRVTLLLAGIASALSFLGRSTGLSVASTSTTS